MNKQLSSGRIPKILPLLIHDVEIPMFLWDIKYADFSKRYHYGFEKLLKAIGKESIQKSFRKGNDKNTGDQGISPFELSLEDLDRKQLIRGALAEKKFKFKDKEGKFLDEIPTKALFREIEARGYLIDVEKLKEYKNNEVINIQDIFMKKVNYLYKNALPSNESFHFLNTWDLARLLIFQIDQFSDFTR